MLQLEPHPDTLALAGPPPASPPAFEGSFLHSIRLTARHPRAALTALDQALGAGGAEVRRLYLTSVADRSVADVTVVAVSASAARRIGDALAASVGVEAVSVEHMWAGR